MCRVLRSSNQFETVNLNHTPRSNHNRTGSTTSSVLNTISSIPRSQVPFRNHTQGVLIVHPSRGSRNTEAKTPWSEISGVTLRVEQNGKRKSERDLGTWFKAADTESTPPLNSKSKHNRVKRKANPEKPNFF